MKLFGMLLLAAMLAGAPSMAQAQQAAESAKPTVIQHYTQKQRQDYEKKVAADLAIMQQKLDVLKNKQETVPIQLKRMLLKGLVNLQKNRYAAQNLLTAMKKAPEKSWGGMKANMDRALATWNQSYENLVSRLK